MIARRALRKWNSKKSRLHAVNMDQQVITMRSRFLIFSYDPKWVVSDTTLTSGGRIVILTWLNKLVQIRQFKVTETSLNNKELSFHILNRDLVTIKYPRKLKVIIPKLLATSLTHGNAIQKTKHENK